MCAPLGNFAKIKPPFLGLKVESLDSRWKSSNIFPKIGSQLPIGYK
jgi:hypothetical protein